VPFLLLLYSFLLFYHLIKETEEEKKCVVQILMSRRLVGP